MRSVEVAVSHYFCVECKKICSNAKKIVNLLLCISHTFLGYRVLYIIMNQCFVR